MNNILKSDDYKRKLAEYVYAEIDEDPYAHTTYDYVEAVFVDGLDLDSMTQQMYDGDKKSYFDKNVTIDKIENNYGKGGLAFKCDSLRGMSPGREDAYENRQPTYDRREHVGPVRRSGYVDGKFAIFAGHKLYTNIDISQELNQIQQERMAEKLKQLQQEKMTPSVENIDDKQAVPDVDNKKTTGNKNSNTHDLTMDELIDILSIDGTWKEIKKQIAEKEITQEECDKVLQWVASSDPNVYKPLFQEILNNIKNQPTYDTTAELKQWESYRDQAAKQMEKLKEAQLGLEKAIAKHKKTIEGSSKTLPTVKGKDLEEQLEKIRKANKRIEIAEQKLSVKAKQIEALTLVQAHAKTPERQIENYRDIKSRETLVTSMIRSFGTWGEHVANWKLAIKSVKDLKTLGDEAYKLHKADLKNARLHVKEYNALNQTIKNEEAALMKVAQKIVDREYRRGGAFDGLLTMCKTWAEKGVIVENKEIQKDRESVTIKTLDEAKKIVEKASSSLSTYDEKEAARLQKSLNDHIALRDEHKQTATELLESIAHTIQQNRETIAMTVQELTEMERDGALGYLGQGELDIIEGHVKNAMEDSGKLSQKLIQGRTFQQDLTDFIKGNESLMHSLGYNDAKELDNQEIER